MEMKIKKKLMKLYPLKSDRFGMEMLNLKSNNFIFFRLKSDRFGMEILYKMN